MTKLVNLDELSAPERKLQYKGVVHEVLDLSLEAFVDFQNDFQKMMEAQEKGDMAAVIASAKVIINRCVPTFGETDKLNLAQLTATVQLITDFYPQTEETAGNE